MFQMQGWVVISCAADGEAEDGQQRAVVNAIVERAPSVEPAHTLTVVSHNGQDVLLVNSVPNHEAGLLERFGSFLDEIGRQAPGSYGVVYFRDTDFAPGDRIGLLRSAMRG